MYGWHVVVDLRVNKYIFNYHVRFSLNNRAKFDLDWKIK